MRTFCVVWGTLRILSRRITQPRAKEKDGHPAVVQVRADSGLVPPHLPTPRAQPRPQEACRPCCVGPMRGGLFFHQPPFCSLHPSPTGLHAISQAHHTFSFKSPPPAVFPVKTQCLHSLLLRSSRSLCPNAPHQRSPTQLPPKTAPSCHSQAHYPSLVSAVCNTKTHLLIYYLVFPY